MKVQSFLVERKRFEGKEKRSKELKKFDDELSTVLDVRGTQKREIAGGGEGVCVNLFFFSVVVRSTRTDEWKDPWRSSKVKGRGGGGGSTECSISG